MRTKNLLPIMVASIMVLSVLVTALAVPSGDIVPVRPYRKVEVDKSYDGQTVYLMEGDTLIVHLKTLGAAGYHWDIVECNEDVLTLSDHYTENNNPPGLIGGAVDEYWVYETRCGISRLIYSYAGPDGTVTDYFNLTVVVTTNYFQITYPNGGEIFRPGSICVISWKIATFIDSNTVIPDTLIDIYLYEGSERILQIATDVNILQGSYEWHITPDFPEGNDYRIGIFDEANPEKRFDFSDDTFSIVKESHDEVRLVLDADPHNFALHVFTLVPEPIRIDPILDGRIHAVYHRGTTVNIIAQPVYKNYGFTKWTGTDITTSSESSDPLVVKMNKDRSYTAHYRQMSDSLQVSKNVWNDKNHSWEKSTEIVVDDPNPSSIVTVRFKCFVKPMIFSTSQDSKVVLYAIDELPKNMRYVNGSSNYNASYNEYQNRIVWFDLPLSGATIYFDAIVLDEGISINRFSSYLVEFTPPPPEPPVKDEDSKDVETLYLNSSLAGFHHIDWRMDYALVYVNFIKYYTLTTHIQPEGSGHIIIDPKEERYQEGTVVNLTAVPDDGYRFDHWVVVKYPENMQGQSYLSNSNPLRLVMDADTVVTAEFVEENPEEFTLTTIIQPEGAGSIEKTPDLDQYPENTTITLTAIPNSGYIFDHWSGDISGDENPVTVVMNSDKTVIAVFAPLNHPPSKPVLSSPENGSTGVSVNPILSVEVYDPDNDDLDVYFIDASDDSLIDTVTGVSSGETVSTVWYGLDYNTTYSWYVIVSDGEFTNQSDVWYFTTMSEPSNYYTLSLSVSPEGAGSIEKTPDLDQYPEGTTVTLTAIPNSGYIFDHWSGDVSGSENPVTVVMNSNKTITAVFEVQPEISFSVDDNDDTITVTSVSPSGISWDDIEIYCYNDTDSTYIDMDGEVNAGDVIYVRAANLYGDVTVNITWKPSNLLLASFDLYIEEISTYYTLTLGIDPDGAGYLYVDPPRDYYFEDAEIDYEEGTTVTITAHAYDGYIFDHWSGDASGSSSTIQITMDEGKEITAHFRLANEITINITRPEPYYLYFHDKKVFPTLFRTWIIGPITIEANVTGDVDHVVFLVSEEPKTVDYNPPFTYTWNERAIGRKMISVEAYDAFGNLLAEDHMNVTVINLNRTKGKTEYAVLYGTIYDYNKIINKKIPWAKVVAYKYADGEWKKVDSDRAGRFLFRKGDYKLILEPGYYKIEATARGYDYETRYIELSKGDEKRMNFYLNETITLKGKVKTKGLFGRGIRGANITAIRDDGKIYTTKSRFSGKYRLPLPPGNYTIIVDATSKGYKIYTETGVKIKYRLFRDVIKKNFYLEKSE